MAALNFNAANVAPDTGTGDPIPAGWYIATVTESDIKPTSNGAGARLAVTMTIHEPAKYAGRKVFTGFNIKNDNPVAQDIAFKQLSALAHAVGVLQVEDSQQLHGIPLKIRIKVKPASGQYEAGNDVTAYRNMAEDVKLGPANPEAAGVGAPGVGAPGGMQQPAGFGGGMQMQQPAMQQPVQQMQMQQPVTQMQQQPVQQQMQQPVQQMVQQPAQVMQPQQPVMQQQQPADQAWQQPQAQQPWAGQGGEQVQQQQMQQQPVQQMQQQQAPIQQQMVQQPMQQQPVAQQQVQQPVVQQQMQQQADPATVAAGATPPWMTNGQQPAQ